MRFVIHDVEALLSQRFIEVAIWRLIWLRQQLEITHWEISRCDFISSWRLCKPRYRVQFLERKLEFGKKSRCPPRKERREKINPKYLE